MERKSSLSALKSPLRSANRGADTGTGAQLPRVRPTVPPAAPGMAAPNLFLKQRNICSSKRFGSTGEIAENYKENTSFL